MMGSMTVVASGMALGIVQYGLRLLQQGEWSEVAGERGVLDKGLVLVVALVLLYSSFVREYTLLTIESDQPTR